jgi:hypothetical protein
MVTPPLRDHVAFVPTRSSPILCRLFLLLVLGAAVFLAGCGNVTLRGDAMTAAQQSTMDSYQATLRCGDATTQPASGTIKAYLMENFKQWRSFVRSAKADLTWGPKLAGE